MLAPPLTPLTRSGLLPEARHLVLPEGIVSSGFPSVRETCRRIGIEFDGWQQDLNKCLLAKRSDGLYAADTAVISIPRQVGKTYDLGAVAFALCIAIPRLTVVWTAHRFKVSRESFNEMRSWAKRRQLVPHIDFDEVTTAAGNECIPFRNESRIVFAARERGAIRGFTKVGMLVLDEAQILTEAALSDLVPTTNQAPNPLVILMGTPPKPTDPGEAFTRLRQDALEGESDDVLYVELSADKDADPNDRAQWRKANPSYPKWTPERSMLRMKKLLSPEDFLREGLGIWPNLAAGRSIDPRRWAQLADVVSVRANGARSAIGVAVTPLRDAAAITVFSTRPDGLGHLRLVDWRTGVDWVPGRLVELLEPLRPALVGMSKATAASLERLGDAGLTPPEDAEQPQHGDLITLSAADTAAACSQMIVAVREGTLRVVPSPDLDAAVAGAETRIVGDAVTWARRGMGTEAAPIEAATSGRWVHATKGPLLADDYDPVGQIF